MPSIVFEPSGLVAIGAAAGFVAAGAGEADGLTACFAAADDAAGVGPVAPGRGATIGVAVIGFDVAGVAAVAGVAGRIAMGGGIGGLGAEPPGLDAEPPMVIAGAGGFAAGAAVVGADGAGFATGACGAVVSVGDVGGVMAVAGFGTAGGLIDGTGSGTSPQPSSRSSSGFFSVIGPSTLLGTSARSGLGS
jgi:hypothetical protein